MGDIQSEVENEWVTSDHMFHSFTGRIRDRLFRRAKFFYGTQKICFQNSYFHLVNILNSLTVLTWRTLVFRLRRRGIEAQKTKQTKKKLTT